MMQFRIILICVLSVIGLTVIWNYLIRAPGRIFPTVIVPEKQTSKVYISNTSSVGTINPITKGTTQNKRFTTLSISPPSKILTLHAKTVSPWHRYFHSTMSMDQKKKMLMLLKVFKSQMEKYNITYFLYAGSLIGAHRHHGMIPWDDDIDILVASSQKDIMKTALQELNETHSLKDYAGKDTWKWKFYKLDGQPYSHKPFRYPYLDLFFFKDYNKTMFYVEVDNSWISKRQIFPLIDKEFDGISLPTPCNTEVYLKYNYGSISRCVSPSWNHSTEYGVPYWQRHSVNCDVLRPYFGFVERKTQSLSDTISVSETLRKHRDMIQVVNYFLPLSCTETYSKYDSKLQVKRAILDKS